MEKYYLKMEACNWGRHIFFWSSKIMMVLSLGVLATALTTSIELNAWIYTPLFFVVSYVLRKLAYFTGHCYYDYMTKWSMQ